MNAIDMLHDDHRHLKQMVKNLVKLPMDTPLARNNFVERLEDDLKLHARLEEDVFYPAFQKANNGQHEAMRFEALEEHRLIEQALPDLKAACDNKDAFEGRAKVLKELLEHHINEEEREMFPVAKKLLDDAQLQEIGHLMAIRRADLYAGVSDEVPYSESTTSNSATDDIRTLEERASRSIAAFTKTPTEAIGWGVEEVVRVGANLAGEVFSGLRKGLTETHHDNTKSN